MRLPAHYSELVFSLSHFFSFLPLTLSFALGYANIPLPMPSQVFDNGTTILLLLRFGCLYQLSVLFCATSFYLPPRGMGTKLFRRSVSASKALQQMIVGPYCAPGYVSKDSHFNSPFDEAPMCGLNC